MNKYFHWRMPFIIVLNLGIVILSLFMAFALRYDFILGAAQVLTLKKMLPAVVSIKLLFFWRYGLFSGWWRYVSMTDLIAIFKANLFASAAVVAYAVFVYRLEHIPRSVLILDGFFCFMAVGGVRFCIRILREGRFRISLNPSGEKRLLIAGAGRAGQMIAKEIRLNRDLQSKALGFVDDDPLKRKETFQGIKVLGRCDEVAQLCQRRLVDEVIIAMPSVSGAKIKEIVSQCQEVQVPFKTLPSVGSLIDGSVSVQQLKDVSLEDLLGRAQVKLETGEILKYLQGKCVLVTGAGGSIGAELCRQIARFAPQKLVLFENAETPLFLVEQELRQTLAGVSLYPIIGDIRHRARVEAIFAEFKPQVVFHAAAYKHVPMMEINPAEAVNNNVRGTQVVAETASATGVERFVMISTDKAVNPTSVMGASKRTAEKLVQTLARASQTRFVTVRFGNVLGSSGSVIPTFTEQIRNGGPVTVTHPEVTRFFMTIPEATQLVLQAGSMGDGGEIFLLDMGAPVKILHLAEELIRLSGKEPYEEIDIEITGLRPGEKLHEELLLQGEGVKPTRHEKICVALSLPGDKDTLQRQLDELYAAAKQMNLPRVGELLHEIVPEFEHQVLPDYYRN
ncbi:MAG: nucleoside-diphosphate sugar epimerase/dehydratase [Desulfuromonadaceae bacterium]|nr:nucleoside-diphosphate sugar epimerase/dehydratase [Desulfuromonas sp.]MDY0184888.1 nucleoside-diphosphate sugar epimerase/dehydratase [Desulfuromonadaceae bacterium]